jgi:GrpB-like predicted nucleotidyltransferase (UPF0157 family)
MHCHVVPATDPDVRQMIEFRDLLRSDPAARAAYAAEKRRITAGISDSLDYTHRKDPADPPPAGRLAGCGRSASHTGRFPAGIDPD